MEQTSESLSERLFWKRMAYALGGCNRSQVSISIDEVLVFGFFDHSRQYVYWENRQEDSGINQETNKENILR